MCGLFGEFGPEALRDPADIEAISRTIHHRGPDDGGSETGPGWMLGFRRLAILDLSAAGHQPLHSEDGRYVIAFNGEVYNYLELREELLAQGERFRSGTDTEVVLRLLMREGAAALGRLNGMFAFVFIDKLARRFLIVRDRLGVKPLYLCRQGGGLRFASELKALLAWQGAGRSLNRPALLDFLSLGYLPNATCIFQGYAKLPAGHCLEGDLDNAGQAEPRCYWSVTVAPDDRPPQTDAATRDELQALLADAVRLRMRSDVPVAILMSGGVDSTLVAALAQASGATPVALTAGFAGADEDETDLARTVARHLGLTLRELPIHAASLADVDELARIHDEPFADPSAIPMFRICEAARREATVLLSGDGGDEAFGGYRRYVEMQRHRSLLMLPNWLRRAAWTGLRGRLGPSRQYRLAKATLPDGLIGAVFDGLGLLRESGVRALLPSDLAGTAGDVPAEVARLWSASRGRDILSRQRQFDYGLYLPDDVLVKSDRASMAHSTELRSPFLDYRVVEFAARLPNRLLVSDRQGKLILRDLARERLPRDVWAGRKKGFGVPLKEWLRAPGGLAFARERLLERNALTAGLWSRPGAERLLQDAGAMGTHAAQLIWRLLVLDAWARTWLPTEGTS